MTSACLLGRDHSELGQLSVVGEGRAAIALSRGGAPKTYSYTDPNEDAVGFASADAGMLLVVADGHSGSGGSELALSTLLNDAANSLLSSQPPAQNDESWCTLAYATLQQANSALQAAEAQRGLSIGRTTLSFALVRPAEDLLVYAAAGDSHVIRVGADDAEELGWASLGRRRAHFLGRPEETTHRENSAVGCVPLQGIRAVVLASDGLSEAGIGVTDPTGATYQACRQAASEALTPELCSLAASRRIAQTAMAAHRAQRAGDNIAVAVLWLA